MKKSIIISLALCCALLASAKTYKLVFSTEDGINNMGLSSFISDWYKTDPENGKYLYADTLITDTKQYGTGVKLTFTNFNLRSYFKFNMKKERYDPPFTITSTKYEQGGIKIDAPDGEVITKLTLVNSQMTYTDNDFSRIEAVGYDINSGFTLSIEDGVKSITLKGRVSKTNASNYSLLFYDGITVETKEDATAAVTEIERCDDVFCGSLKSGDKVKFTGKLLAVYQNGNYAYITSDDNSHPAQNAKGVQRSRDVHEARNLLVTGAISAQLSRDDVIGAGASGTLTTIDGTLALIPDDASFVKSDETNAYPIKAKFVTAATLNDCSIGDFVCNLDADFAQNGDSWTATDVNGNAIPIVNRFGMQLQAINAAQFLGFVVANGEAKAVAPVLLDVSTSVTDIAATGLHITSAPGRISITGQRGSIAVYGVTGALIAKDATEISCPPGIYIVVANGAAHKVSVK